MSVTWWRYPAIRFAVGASALTVQSRAIGMELVTTLAIDGIVVDRHAVPLTAKEAMDNFQLTGTLADGRAIDVEVGPAGLWRYGAVARIAGAVVHESHPGRRLGLSPRMAALQTRVAGDTDLATQKLAWQRNRVPLAIDIATGIVFFIVARVWGLQTAAMVGIAIGVALVIAQQFVKTDILGGLALFGIVMLAISAGIAWVLNDDLWIKLRGSVTGSIAAAIFLSDGLFLKGRGLAAKLLRYLPQWSLDARRVAIGMGLTGLTMAGVNALLATRASTEAWLWYKTVGDSVLGIALFFVMIRFARTRAA